MEYYTIRHSAGLIDVSPLYKYEITGLDALPLLDKVVTRDISKFAKGQIHYSPWCDERGKTVDDGTIWNLGDSIYRLTSAEPSLKWLEDNGVGMDVHVEDISEDLGTLSLQGPSSRAILHEVVGDAIEKLKFFRFADYKAGKIPITISRTGYTGDLGYEIWVKRDHAEALWDTIVERGRPFGLQPAGQTAMDLCRIEAGFILGGVDYTHSRHAAIEAQRYSPLELSLDWCVALDKRPFVGRDALREEQRRGVPRRVVGIEIDWATASQFFTDLGLAPAPPQEPWAAKVPIYSGYHQVGFATSGCWSPTLKKYIALATLRSAFAQTGTPLEIDIDVEWERHRAPARVVERPFYEPDYRKK